MTFDNIFLFFSGIAYIIALLLATVSIKKRSSNFSSRAIKIFLFVVIASFGWFVFNTMSLVANNSELLTLIGIRGTLSVSVAIIPLLFIFFNNLFKQFTFFSEKFEIKFIIISLLVGLISFLPITVPSVEITKESITPTFGPTFGFFAIWILISVAYTVIVIWRHRQNRTLALQNKWLYVFWGFLLTISLILITNLTLVILGSDKGVLFGPSTLLIFVYLCLYAIDTSRLIDVKFALNIGKRYLTATMLTGILILSINYLILSKPTTFYWVSLAVSILLVISSRLTAEYIEPTSKFDKEIKSFVNIISIELKINKILLEIQKILKLSINSSSVSFLIISKDNKSFSISFSKNGKLVSKNDFFELGKITKKIWKNNKQSIISTSDINSISASITSKNKLRKVFEDLKIELIAPLNKKVTLNGILILGRKKDHVEYSKNDVDLIEEIIQFSSVAISRALLYQETSNFAEKLAGEVKKRTADLEHARADLETKNLQLNNAYHELKTLDDAKSEFISIASHQLRTPISIIKGYLSMVLENDFGDLKTEQIEVLTKVASNLQQLNDIVEDILNASRIERGKLVISPANTDIIELAKNVISQIKGKAEAKKLKLVFKTNMKKFIAAADRNKIYEVIMNLIDNSINYTKEGSITVECVPGKSENEILISVKDTGIGIPDKFRDKIFKRFSRSENARQVRPDGTGIGLYVVKSFVEAHKGEIWFESKEDKGTTFFVKLQAKPEFDFPLDSN